MHPRTFICAIAALIIVAGTVAVIYAVKIRSKNQPLQNGSQLSEGYGSLLNKHVPLSDVYYIIDVGSELPADPGQYPGQVSGQYVYYFGKPSEEGLRYIGLWVSEEIMQAIRFNEDGTANYYLLKDASSFSQAELCCFDISDGVLTLYDVKNELYGLTKISFHDSYITIQPEDEKAMVFKKAENELADKRPNFGMNDAMAFRNIPWTYDDENLQISFGESGDIVFYRTDTETRIDKEYSWDANNDTVTFPDWNDPEGGNWTGRIEDGYLIITSGDRTITLYDPYEVRDKSFPVNVYLNSGAGYYSNRLIVFEPDGGYKIILVRKNFDINDENTWSYCYSGRYELEGTPEDADGKYVTIYPSGEDCPLLEQGEDLRFFADYADLAGERFLFKREGDCVMMILKDDLGTMKIRLYPYTAE